MQCEITKYCLAYIFFFVSRKLQYNLSTLDLVYCGFLFNLAKNSGPDNYPVYLNVENTSVIIPPATKLGGGYTGITLSVRPSVRPSVCPSVDARLGKMVQFA